MGYSNHGLTFDTLRGANVERLPQFKNALGGQAHSMPDGSDWSLGEWMNALTGEVGELANLVKKIRRGDVTQAEVQQQLADELADIATYLDLVAFRMGVHLDMAILYKWNAVSIRVGSDIRIASDDWHRV